MATQVAALHDLAAPGSDGFTTSTGLRSTENSTANREKEYFQHLSTLNTLLYYALFPSQNLSNYDFINFKMDAGATKMIQIHG